MTFAPQLARLPLALSDEFSSKRLARNARRGLFDGTTKRYSYGEVVASVHALRGGKRAAPCAVVGWDNTPRRGRHGVVIHGAGAAEFGEDFVRCLGLAKDWDAEEPLVFVNAWNEWAEGCHLEPDLRNGRSHLEQIRSAMMAAQNQTTPVF
jgi:hypothetical protein